MVAIRSDWLECVVANLGRVYGWVIPFPYIAHMRAERRLKRPKKRKCDDPRLWAVIWDKLKVRWSPQQICVYLRRCFPDNQSMNPCVETIYQSIFIQAKGEFCRWGACGAFYPLYVVALFA